MSAPPPIVSSLLESANHALEVAWRTRVAPPMPLLVRRLFHMSPHNVLARGSSVSPWGRIAQPRNHVKLACRRISSAVHSPPLDANVFQLCAAATGEFAADLPKESATPRQSAGARAPQTLLASLDRGPCKRQPRRTEPSSWPAP
eukprot:scaffold240_cov243-Pinguiococcus_pyrenoidosus.AAC.15